MGAVCVGLNDSEGEAVQGAHTVFGDTVALFGALCYGMYTTVLKYKVRECSFVQYSYIYCIHYKAMLLFIYSKAYS